MMASRIVRRVSQTRNFSTIFERKNTIKDVRAKYYANPEAGAGNPTYLKEPADKAFVGAAFGGLFVGMSVIIYGLYGMTYGVNKVAGH